VTGLDIMVGSVYKAYNVSGRVVEATTGQPVANSTLRLFHRNLAGGWASSHIFEPLPVTDKDGEFKIPGLVPGRFFLSVLPQEGVNLYAPVVDFEIKDEDLSGLEVRVAPGATVSGRVVVEDCDNCEATLGGIELLAEADDILGPDGVRDQPLSRQATVRSDGGFEISGLRQGGFRLSLVTGSEAWRHFDIVRLELSEPNDRILNDKETDPLSDHFAIGNKQLTGLRVLLKRHNARITCHVNTLVTVIPQGTLLMVRLARRMDGNPPDGVASSTDAMFYEVDPHGYAIIDDLDPGDYQLSICDEFSELELTERKKVVVERNVELRVSIDLDLGRIGSSEARNSVEGPESLNCAPSVLGGEHDPEPVRHAGPVDR
jgi:hypothetical protein